MKQLNAELEEKDRAMEQLEQAAKAAGERGEQWRKEVAGEVESIKSVLLEGRKAIKAKFDCLDATTVVMAAAVTAVAEGAVALNLMNLSRAEELQAVLGGLEREVAATEQLQELCATRLAQAVRGARTGKQLGT